MSLKLENNLFIKNKKKWKTLWIHGSKPVVKIWYIW